MSRRPWGPPADDGSDVILSPTCGKRPRMSRARECDHNTAMLLAGDVGGTKPLLGLFMSKPDRPSAIDVGEFVTLDHSGLEPMIESFLQSRQVEARHIKAASFGVAGAVTDEIARLTNVPWR